MTDCHVCFTFCYCRDAEVRPALRAYLEEQGLACPDTALIEELGLCQGRARIDLATVSGVELLDCHNAAAGVRSKPRPAVWDRVCEVLDLTQVRSAVRYRLRSRAATVTSA